MNPHFLRDVNVGSIFLLAAIPLLILGGWYGVFQWVISASQGIKASSGTVMLATLPLIMGFQLLLSFLLFDVGNVPKDSVHLMLSDNI